VIRYMGNKLALLPAIRQAVERLAPAGSLVVDPMAGSHAVTRALKARHPILASDAQAYSAVLGRAFVDNADVPRIEPERVAAWTAAADDDAPAGFFERTYADTYLGALQCRQLDRLRAGVDRLHPDGDDPRRWLLLAALMAAACRAQASPGHFAQFLRPDHPRTQPLRRIDLAGVAARELARWRVEPGRGGSRSLALPWRVLAEREAEALRPARLWYVDPPYTRDQYSRFYHLLETIARGDRPAVRHGARYREDRFKSAFCSPRSASAELADLLGAVRRVSPDATVLLSYSSRGLLALDGLRAAAAGAGFAVAGVSELPHVYSTQGKGSLRGVVEWLVSLTP
jgi:adenine-specific DNA-methyltransferase